MMALVGMCGLNSCSEDCDHDFIEVDYSKELVGTWTCLQGNYAEALVINADGSVLSTGVEDGEYWENIKGNIKTINNKMIMTFEDNDNSEGRFEMLSGEAFTIYEEDGESFTYRYCAKDLSKEIVGMWVCTDSKVDAQNDMLLQTFNDNGTTLMTGYLPESEDAEYVLNQEGKYKVIGDLVFLEISTNEGSFHVAKKMIYTPNGTAYGDVMTFNFLLPMGDNMVASSESWLRIKQSLDLTGKAYDYSATYLTNAKGEDKDIPFLDTSFNFAKMDGSIIDKFLKSILFSVEFPDANTIKYSYLLEGENIVMTAPIEVEGNKMTIKMSETIPVYQDVEIYTFQDQDNTQMHLYMPTASFEKFFANTSVAVMLGHGQLDINDAEAIAEVYKSVADALESINLTIILK